MPSRCAVDRNYKPFVYVLFANFDISWAYGIITSSVAATGEGYVLSYGQVWLPLFAFGGRILTKHLPA